MWAEAGQIIIECLAFLEERVLKLVLTAGNIQEVFIYLYTVSSPEAADLFDPGHEQTPDHVS